MAESVSTQALKLSFVQESAIYRMFGKLENIQLKDCS